jgi:hypothetical protein
MDDSTEERDRRIPWGISVITQVKLHGSLRLVPFLPECHCVTLLATRKQDTS